MRVLLGIGLLGVLSFGQTSFTSGAVALPANNGVVSSTIPVSGLSGTITKVTVSLNNFTQSSYPNDRNFVLVSPGNVVFKFFAGAGGFHPVSGTFVFDDSAAALTTGHDQLVAGTYKPIVRNNRCGEAMPASAPAANTNDVCAAGDGSDSRDLGTATFANRYNGANPNGTWTLWAATPSDPGDPAGTLDSWTITITVAAATASTTTSLSSNNNPSFTSGASSSVTLTATVTKASDSSAVTSGTVTFKDGATQIGSPVAVSGGTASLTTTFGTEGAHTVSAVYADSGTTFGTSTGTLTQTVDNHTTGTSPTFCNTGTVTIPASAVVTPYPQHVFVSGLTGSVSALSLQLTNFTHSFPRDVNFLLVGPTGVGFVPMALTGGGTQTNNVTLTLADTSGALIPDASPATGAYLPTDRKTSITFPSPAPAGPYKLPAPQGTDTFGTAFAGTGPNGTWSLYVTSASSDTGSLGGYCVTFTTSSAAATSTAVTTNLNPAFLTNSVTISATVTSSGSPVPSGSVTFKEGTTVLAGPVTVNGSGVATFTTNSLAEGAHTITAYYSGVPGSYNVSNGAITQQVDSVTTVNGNQYCNAGGMNIASGATSSVYPSHVYVSNVAGVISGLTMELDTFSHTFGKDFAAMLVAPSGSNLVTWAGVGGSSSFGPVNLTFDDAASGSVPTNTNAASGSYKPTAATTAAFPSPATGPFSYPASIGSSTFASAFDNLGPNGIWTLYAANVVSGSTGTIGKWCINLSLTPPVLSITKTHSGNFRQGQTGATYTVTVTNNGPGSTAGTVTVVDNPPASGLTITGISGTNWSCTLATLTCTRSDVLGSGNSYDPITVTATVANNAPSSVTNKATVSGGGSTGSVQASDPTTINPVADMTVTKSHTGNFYQGQTGATYTLTVTNSGAGPTSGAVVVSDSIPAGLTFVSISGSNWTCTQGTFSCTRSDVLAAGGSYDTVTVTVNVNSNAPASVTNQATVTGGGEINNSNNTANDPTTVDVPPTVTSFKVLWGSQSYELIGSARNRLPWQITGIRVTFSKAITTGNAASLSGITATGFSGLGTSTLTWTFSAIPLGSINAALAGSGGNALADAAGGPLAAGTGYSQALKVLYADFTDDGVVNASDLGGINAARAAAYNQLADLNGDGVVDITDVSIARTRVGTTLP